MDLFKKPTVAKPEPAKALPREDDEAARLARRKTYAALAKTSGREATRLGGDDEALLGNYEPADTRTGSAVLSG